MRSEKEAKGKGKAKPVSPDLVYARLTQVYGFLPDYMAEKMSECQVFGYLQQINRVQDLGAMPLAYRIGKIIGEFLTALFTKTRGMG